MRESESTARLMREIEDDGGVTIPLVGSYMSSGWPDRLVYHRLWHGLIELKAPRGKLSDQQRASLRKLRERRSAHAVVVRFPERVEDELGELLTTFDGTGPGLMRALSVL